MNKLIIRKPKGIAQKQTNPHEYILPKIGLVVIHTRKIKESSTFSEKGPIPSNVEETKTSTRFEILQLPLGIDGPKPVLLDEEVPGDKTDEDALALIGYYLSDYDELQEARKIRRLIDLARFVEI
jgi:hypothetical protein